ncbi:MAG: DVUA0089 family protein [Deltaproteobacteria bacterium]|nr:DVUA0089 family protein [Deltaproteobacteria bacterium]
MIRNRRTRVALAAALSIGFAACGGDKVPPPPGKDAPVINKFSATPAGPVAPGASVQLSWDVAKATSVSIRAGSTTILDGSTEAIGMVSSGPIQMATTFTLTASGEGGQTTRDVTVNVDANAVTIVRFEARPPVVPLNGTTTLEWQVAGATRVRIARGGADIVDTTDAAEIASGSLEDVLIDAGMVTFTLIASNATKTEMQDVVVIGAQIPRILSFRVRPALFTGASADITLTWVTEGAGTISLTANGTAVPNVTNAPTATVTVSVTDQTTFVLTVQNGLGEVQATKVVARGVPEVEPNDSSTAATSLMGGATGQINPGGDRDFYSITVPAGGNVYAETSDGQGGCGLDTLLGLVAPDGNTIIASNDDGGEGFCSMIDPRTNAQARDLPAGTYFIRVVGYNNQETGPYALVVSVEAGRCGNQILEASLNESCDDGNTATGDGCSPTCQLEITGTHNGPSGEQVFMGTLAGAQQHVYAIELSSRAYLRAETFAPTRGQCMGAFVDTELLLLNATGTVTIGRDDDGGMAPCSRIDPNQDTFANLEPGRYLLVVRPYNNSTRAVGDYVLVVSSFGPGCGNSVPEAGEHCDDGNTTNGDGCDSTCRFELAQTFSPPGGSASAVLTETRPYAAYGITLSAGGQSVTATVSDPAGGGACGPDSTIYLLDSAGNALAQDGGGFGSCPVLMFPAEAGATDLATGSYILLVGLSGTSTGAIKLDVGIINPRCGDRVIQTQANEGCDDGNARNGDGCSATCQLEGNFLRETEPNNMSSQATATGATRGGAVIRAVGAMPSGDEDFWSFDIGAGQTASVTALTYGSPNDRTTCNGDTIITLLDANGLELARNDDPMTGELCGKINPDTVDMAASNLPAGRYYLRVVPYSTTRVPQYFLDVQLTP